MEIKHCECCKKLETVSLYRGWFLYWNCTDQFMKRVGIQL
jgi:hypothetical protein